MEPLGSRSSARIQAARDKEEEERKEGAVLLVITTPKTQMKTARAQDPTGAARSSLGHWVEVQPHTPRETVQ